MDFAAGPPSRWVVTLRSGATVELAADGFTEHDGHALFSVLANATSEEQEQVQVLGWSVAAPAVLVLVAKVPMVEVAKIEGGEPWSSTRADAEPQGT
ncbi:hypothetical protein [Micromonospora endolithica]|uniref:Uncharacterized protein n=1 Tax=Micromonospora endolithica TaxID=230091 RepID=A0A3A9Z9Z0_9ACTN|nr:hypothetical protein [Micromonospora endolithica]RKN45241.1 hypothetical protein D7223_16505 [Micromonospora endolithica]